MDRKFYSSDPSTSYNYGKIINKRQFDRLVKYLEQGNILYGGQFNASQLYIAPTLMGDIASDAPVMSDEILDPYYPSFHSITKTRLYTQLRQTKPVGVLYFHAE